MKQKLCELIEKMLEDAISNGGKEEIEKAVNEIDFGDIVDRLFDEDPEVKKALYERAKSIVLEEIKNLKNLKDIGEDALQLGIREGIDVNAIIKDVMLYNDTHPTSSKKGGFLLIPF